MDVIRNIQIYSVNLTVVSKYNDLIDDATKLNEKELMEYHGYSGIFGRFQIRINNWEFFPISFPKKNCEILSKNSQYSSLPSKTDPWIYFKQFKNIHTNGIYINLKASIF